MGIREGLGDEVGLAGTHIPEEFGGFGFGSIELGIAAEEMGKHLYCGPFFSSSVMAACALLNCANDINKTEILPSIALGTTLATLVLDSLNTPNDIGIKLSVNENLLTGTAGLVLDALEEPVLDFQEARPTKSRNIMQK